MYDERRAAQPEVIRVVPSGGGGYVQAPHQHSYARAPGGAPYAWPVVAPQHNGRYPQPVHGAPAPVQQMPRGPQYYSR